MKKRTIVILIVLGLLLLLGGYLYIGRKKFYPKAEEVTYLRVELAKGLAQVRAGVRVQNRLPIRIRIDSINYQIRSNGATLGWGRQLMQESLPALGERTLDFRLQLDFEKYRSHLSRRQSQDSVKLDVAVKAYIELPFLKPQVINLHRTVTAPVPKAPMMQFDSVYVRQFSPESGYSLLLLLQASNQNLPGLRIADFDYHIRFADSTGISGHVDTTFQLQRGRDTLQVPLRLSTADALQLLEKKLKGPEKWRYSARLQATVLSDHPLFEKVAVSLQKSGTLDLRQLDTGKDYQPTVKRLLRLELEQNQEQTQLVADVLVHNPSPVPFYIDSASYSISYKGKAVAWGRKDFEQVLPKQGDQRLRLRLQIDNEAFSKLQQAAEGQEKLPLDLALNLVYDLPGKERQQIRLRRQVAVQVPAGAGLQVAGLEVKELDPEKGAHLLLRLKVDNDRLPALTLQDLRYEVQLRPDIQISGRTKEPLHISRGTAEVAVPLQLSADDVNALVKRALEGKADWRYTFTGTATLTAPQGLLRHTTLSLESSGTFRLSGQSGTTRLMPGVQQVDTLDVTIRYDTAWVRLHVRVDNPLPVPVTVSGLKLQLAVGTDTFALLRERQSHRLPAKGEATAWLTLGVRYALWGRLLQERQEQDSLSLSLTTRLEYQLGALPLQTATLRDTLRLPVINLPVTELTKTKVRGFGFRKGVQLKGLVAVNNASAKGLQVQDIFYQATLQQVGDLCATLNRVYTVPLGHSVQEVPLNLSVIEAFRALAKKLFGSPKWEYQLNATARARTANPKLQQVYVIFENKGVADLSKKKSRSSPAPPAPAAR